MIAGGYSEDFGEIRHGEGGIGNGVQTDDFRELVGFAVVEGMVRARGLSDLPAFLPSYGFRTASLRPLRANLWAT